MSAVPQPTPGAAPAGAAERPGAAVLLSHPHGNVFVRDAAVGLADAGDLREFWTGVAWSPDSPLARLAPRQWRAQLERRAFPPPVRPFLRTHPWREAARLGAARAGLGKLADSRWLSPNACHVALDRKVAGVLRRARAGMFDTVYAYDHGALETFRVARERGMRRVYDLPIGYWRELAPIIEAERERWPEWRDTTVAPTFPEHVYARKDQELALADAIVVPSAFVAGTLVRHFRSLAPVHVVPFGAPSPAILPAHAFDRPPGRLRVLYVGGLDLRKGVPYLFEALDRLQGAVDATIVGRAHADCVPLRRALAKCRYFETLPRTEVLARMREADVFVFPTLFEGMALVVLEAMSQGCAVVTTANAGYEGVVEDGVNGFLVPLRSSEAVATTLQRLDGDRALLADVRRAARATAARLTAALYRERIVAVCRASRRPDGAGLCRAPEAAV